jgi:hypothetical protein
MPNDAKGASTETVKAVALNEVKEVEVVAKNTVQDLVDENGML